jgi:hypothetical protein
MAAVVNCWFCGATGVEWATDNFAGFAGRGTLFAPKLGWELATTQQVYSPGVFAR